MPTTVYFDEFIKDKDGKLVLRVELGRSWLPQEDHLYLSVNGKSLLMDRATASRFVNAVASLGRYYRLLE